MEKQNQKEILFVNLLTENQSRIYAYILSLTADPHLSNDILQESNMALWRKSEEYDSAKPFLAWAFGFAKMQVLAARRKTQRDRLVFSDEIFERITLKGNEWTDDFNHRLATLSQCLDKLPPKHREIISLKYQKEQKISEIASILRQNVGNIKVLLSRIRRTLAECIETSTREENAL